MSNSKRWEIIYILPNIRISEPFENKFVAIVNRDDERINEITSMNQNLGEFLDKFHDQFSNQIKPSILIKSRQFKYNSTESLVSFRNILAISVITKGLEHRFQRPFQAYPLHSEHFDFYPLTTSINNEILYDTPHINGLLDIENFNAQSKPFLSGLGNFILLKTCYLLNFLNEIWLSKYTKSAKTNLDINKLFRSLEMAYQASSIPDKNNNSIYDHGVSTSLWISAFEILAHPGQGPVDKWKVIKLIGEYYWHVKSTITRNSFKIARSRKISLVQKLYYELNETRNDFLHGNKITHNSFRPYH
ncbi:hypothetical protein ACFODZ_15685 [Marinicella sediminis]|uniref:Apea-like HEPN domain-containing protein n=1 Tax=Marinicella sediminis TaxID=1792834 RepID=A0ABV7JHY4_9GAMM|nr:hypothetical protein [Marinicella sediminis]